MSLDDSDEKLALLREIRDEVLGLRGDTHYYVKVLADQWGGEIEPP